MGRSRQEPAPLRVVSRSEVQTRELGAGLVPRLEPSGVLLLYGPMGVGKTVLVQGLAAALGVAQSEVQSPTFTLIHHYRGARGALVHIDLFRLGEEDLQSIGLDEALAGSGIKVVEWAERLPADTPAALRLALERGAKGRLIRELGAEELPPD